LRAPMCCTLPTRSKPPRGAPFCNVGDLWGPAEAPTPRGRGPKRPQTGGPRPRISCVARSRSGCARDDPTRSSAIGLAPFVWVEFTKFVQFVADPAATGPGIPCVVHSQVAALALRRMELAICRGDGIPATVISRQERRPALEVTRWAEGSLGCLARDGERGSSGQGIARRIVLGALAFSRRNRMQG